ncbi:MAG: hypothetical protein GY774_34590 [Planctomycetes bacterium]|nr:hypothetical protein [Planctomycetota bacterium]
MSIHDILINASDDELANEIINSYKEVVENFVLENWKYSELDAGHFVEAVRRFLELKLFGNYTPFNERLSNFSNTILTAYENAKGDASYRILIPRILYSIYTIRNKRGAGHLTGVSPNEMDATCILYSVKWVLSELVRLNSTLSTDETSALISSIVERQIDLIWKQDGVVRILDTRIPKKQQVLVLLYDEKKQSENKLRETIEYSNPSNFRKVLKGFHKKRFLEYDAARNICTITPKGLSEAEKIIKKYQDVSQ